MIGYKFLTIASLSILLAVVMVFCVKTPEGPALHLPIPAASETPAMVEKSSVHQASTDNSAHLKNQTVRPPQEAAPQAVKDSHRKKVQEFSDWLARWSSADGFDKNSEAEGLSLARERREALLAMIQNQEIPDEALFVRPVDRQNLPASILDILEKPVSAVGEIRSWAVLGEICDHGANAACQHKRGLEIELPNGATYALVGKRIPPVLEAHGKLPVRGYALGSTLVMAEHPLRLLDRGEVIPPGAVVQSAGNHAGSQSPATAKVAAGQVSPKIAEIGGQFVSFASEETFNNYRLAYSYEGWGGTGSAAASTFSNVPRAANNDQVGRFRVLYLSVSYSDEPWAHVTETEAEQNCRLAQQAWNEFSYGKMKAEFVVAPHIVLPFTKGATTAGKGEASYLSYWARIEACKHGYDYREFNTSYIVVARWGGGIAAIGGDWAVNWNPSVGLILHEGGHNLGLNHSDAQGAPGRLPYRGHADNEAGSPFDYMGSNYLGASWAHYHVQHKLQLNWLHESHVIRATTDGDFRIHAMDQPRLEDGKHYGLLVRKDDNSEYVLEHRANSLSLARQTPVLYTLKSAYISYLLDTTYKSYNDRYDLDFRDAGLTPGRTYSDFESDFHFTVVSENDTVPASVDIAFRRGPFPGNEAPMVSLAASSLQVNPSDAVTFSANATDPNGDRLAYHWDFGDRSWQPDRVNPPNAAQCTKSFNAVGQVTAMLTVSDMKGGITRRHVMIEVGSPTQRAITGRILEGDRPVVGARIAVSGSNRYYAFTDSDGYYILSNLPSSPQTLEVAKIGYTFAPAEFSNPVPATSSVANWAATSETMLSLASTANATESGGVGAFRLSRSGSTALPLQVRVSRPTGSAQYGTDYTLSPAPAIDPLLKITGYNSFTIPAGAAYLDIAVNPLTDGIADGPETVRLQLVSDNAQYKTGGPGAAEVTIGEEDAGLPQASILATTTDAYEGGAAGTLTVSRTGSTTDPLQVGLLWSGTAVPGTDVSPLPSEVTIPAGLSAAEVAVVATDDNLLKTGRTVVADIAPRGAYIKSSSSHASFQIYDNDASEVHVTVIDGLANEHGDSAVFEVRRNGSTASDLWVSYTLTGTSVDGADYPAQSCNLLIPAGRSEAQLVISPYHDNRGETTETVILSIVSKDASYRAGAGWQGTARITDDDPASVEVRPGGSVLAGQSASFLFYARGSIGDSVTLQYTLAGSAVAGVDYVAQTGSIVVPFNLKTELLIPTLDTGVTANSKSLVLTISPSPAYLLYESKSGTLSIRANVSDSNRVTVTRSFVNWQPTVVTESSTKGTFLIGRGGSTGALEVFFTMGGTATPGVDYTGIVSGSVIIPDGSNSVVMDYTPVDDSLAEGPESIVMTILERPAYSIDLIGAAAELLHDNDATLSVGFQSPQALVSESDSPENRLLDVPVVLSAPLATPVEVKVTTVSGSAIGSGVDWEFVDPTSENTPLLAPVIRFEPGETNHNVRIRVIKDGLVETLESIRIGLESVLGAVTPSIVPEFTLFIVDQGASSLVEAGLFKEERWNTTSVYDNNNWGSLPPDHSGYLVEASTAQSVGDRYSRRLSGVFTAPATGTYVFSVASDDSSRLYISPDRNPANKVQVASLTGWSNFQEWTKFASQQTVEIALAAGGQYYIEAQHLENSGGDHLSIAWRGPDFETKVLSAVAPQAQAPSAVRFAEGNSSTLESDGPSAGVWVLLDSPVAQTPVSVDCVLVGGTATRGTDFDYTPQTVVFQVGEQSKWIPIVIRQDGNVEGPENIDLSLANAVGVSLATPSVHRLIIKDAMAPVVDPLVATALASQAADSPVAIATAKAAPSRTIEGWSIVAGNPGNAFSISNSGVITLAKPGTLPATGDVNLVIRATDNEGAWGEGTAQIICPGAGGGLVREERWPETTRYDYLNWDTTPPSYAGTLPTLTSARNIGDFYSRRLTGWLKPQASGTYFFWLAGDNRARLYLGADASESSKKLIAAIDSATSFQAWDELGTQGSAGVSLVAGQLYWIEVQQVEQSYSDSVSVAWSGPGIQREAIPSSAMAPFPAAASIIPKPLVSLPQIVLTSPFSGSVALAGNSVSLAAAVQTNGALIDRVEFYDGGTLLGSDTVAPYQMDYDNVALASHLRLRARAVFDETFVDSEDVAVTFLVPQIALTSPLPGSRLRAGVAFHVAASVQANSATLDRVDFYDGTTLIGTDTEAPYQIDYNNLTAATNVRLRARAVFNGTFVDSAEVSAMLIYYKVWTGIEGSNWADAGNWNPLAVPETGGDLLFDDTAAGYTVAMSSFFQPGSIAFGNTNAYAVIAGPGSGFSGSSGLVKSGSGLLSLGGAGSTYSGSVQINEGTLRLMNNESLGNSGKTIQIASGGAADLYGNSPSVAATGRHYTWSIAGDGVGGAGAIVNSGADVFSNAGILNLTLTGNASIGGTGSFDIGLSGWYAGAINGGGFTLTKTGPNTVEMRAPAHNISYVLNSGSLVFENTDSASGTNKITVNGGTLASAGRRTLPNDVDFTSAGAVLLSRGDSATWNGTLDLHGDVTFQADRDLNINGSVTGTGTITKTGSYALRIGTGGTTGELGGCNVNITAGRLEINRSGALTIGGNLSGSGSLFSGGSGTTTLAGSNTYTGYSRIQGGGTLEVTTVADAGGPGSIGTLSSASDSWLGVRDNSTLRITGSDTQVTGRRIWNDASLIGADLIGAGTFDVVNAGTTVSFTDRSGSIIRTLIKAGLGKLSVAQAIKSTAGVSVTGGILNLSSVNSYSGITSISSGATLEFSSSSSQTLTGSLTGNGKLLKSGSGTLTVANADNTFSGNVEVSAGKLVLGEKAPLQFVVTDGGCNQVVGTGTVILQGDFVIDTSAVTALQASWSLVDASTLAESFTSTFNLLGTGWVETANVWTLIDGEKTWSFSEATGELSLTTVLTPYETWAVAKDLTGADAGATADPDQDRVSNGLEYILGTDPHTANQGEQLSIDAISGSIVVSFVAQEASGLGYAGMTRYYMLQSTQDLADPDSWTAVPGYSNVAAANQTVIVTQSASLPVFYRLSVTLR